jgi:hypothetical protein
MAVQAERVQQAGAGFGREAIEDGHDHQGDDAGTIRRTFPDIVAGEIGADGGHEFGGVQAVGEISLGMQATTRIQGAHHRGRQVPFIKRLRTFAGDFAQAGGERRQTHDLTGMGCRAPDQHFLCAGAAQLFLIKLPIQGDARRDHVAFFRKPDGRPQNFVQPFAAMCCEQHLPGAERAGDGYRVGRNRAQFENSGFVQRVHAERSGRAAGAVQGDDGLAIGLVQAEAVAADAGRLRFHHGEHGGRGNGGIQRVAAGAQHLDGRECRLRHRGRGHRPSGIDGAAARRMEITHRSTLRQKEGQSFLGQSSAF